MKGRVLDRQGEIIDSRERSRRLPSWLFNFLEQSGAPLNLAIFRIVIFLRIPFCRDFTGSLGSSFLPSEFRVAPYGWQPILDWLPINPTVDGWACALLLVACVTTAIGFHTRKSAIIASLLATYVFLVPQLAGGFAHNDLALLWFAYMLAASPCGDVLSVDAAIKAWRTADSSAPSPTRQSLRYGVPAKFIFVLLGIIYLFPGLCKLHALGLDWGSAHNMRQELWSHWVSERVVSPLRVDQSPLLCHILGLSTLAFETSAILLVLFPLGRAVLVVAGPLFHSGIWLLMGIQFLSLQLCYVGLVDWQYLCQRLSVRFIKQPKVIEYDAADLPTRRRLSVLKAFDFFNAYRCVERQKGTEDFRERETVTISSANSGATPTLLPAIVVGSVLIVGNIICGAGGIATGYPMSCFPRFDKIPPSERREVVFEALDKKDHEIPIRLPDDNFDFGADRWRKLCSNVSKIKAGREVAIQHLWKFVVLRHTPAGKVHTVRFIDERFSIDPADAGENPVRSEVLYEFNPDQK
ncbi:MAG TPA: HTTM domain-containing protein [Planktothrix sp.]